MSQKGGTFNTAAPSSLSVEMPTEAMENAPDVAKQPFQLKESPSSALPTGLPEEEEQSETHEAVAKSESASGDSVVNDRSPDRSDALALAHVRQRNALYSKRKYYKRKQEVQRLENQRFELQVNNQKLRKENDQLERLLQSVVLRIKESLSQDSSSFAHDRSSQPSIRSAARISQSLRPAAATRHSAPDDAFLRQRLSRQQYAAVEAALLRDALQPQYHSLASLRDTHLLQGLSLPPLTSNDLFMESTLSAQRSDLLRLIESANTARNVAPIDPITSLLLEQYRHNGEGPTLAQLPQFADLANDFRAPIRMPTTTEQALSLLDATHRRTEQQLLLELLLQQQQSLPAAGPGRGSSFTNVDAEGPLLQLLRSKPRGSSHLPRAPSAATEWRGPRL